MEKREWGGGLSFREPVLGRSRLSLTGKTVTPFSEEQFL